MEGGGAEALYLLANSKIDSMWFPPQSEVPRLLYSTPRNTSPLWYSHHCGYGPSVKGWCIGCGHRRLRLAKGKHGKNGSMFNTFESLSGVVTPIGIRYFVQSMGLVTMVYVSLNAPDVLIVTC